MIPLTVACLVYILRRNKDISAPPGCSMEEPKARRAAKNLLTNCQAQDILAYRFPLLRATSRRAAHGRTRGMTDGRQIGSCGCGVTAQIRYAEMQQEMLEI